MNFDELWGRSTPNSWARVPRGPFAAAVGTFLFGSTGIMAAPIIGGISAATMVGFLITTAITSWALSALAPRPEGGSRSLLANVKEAAGPFDIVYGEVRKGGVVTFLETTDRIGYKVFKNDYLHQVIVLAGHEVEEIGDIYLNDEVVTLDANGFVTGDRWKSLIRIKKHLGAPNQVADPDLVAETSVTSDFRGRGIAYLYVRMDWDKDVFASGSPTITAKVKGRKVYDPRTGTTAWSDNAALCIRDYIAQPFGVNSAQSPNSMASNSWSIGANVCDTLVTLKGGGTEKRYTINGVVSTANTPKDNIQQMLTACGGTLFWGQGQWQFKPGYLPAAPYTQFGVDDLRGDISLVTKNSRKENFNAVTGLFVDKNQGYTQVEYPKLSSAVFLARDNGQENVLDVTLPFTVKATTAQRLAKMAMFRSREEMVISADFSLKAANVKVGDVIQFTFDRYGFSNKLFEVVTWKPVLDSGELKFNLILKETSAAAYDWNAEEKDIIGNDTTLPDPTAGLSVSNLTVTNRQTLQADGTSIGEVVLSWTEAESAFIDKYTVQWKRTTDTNWSATETDNSSIVLPSVVAGLPYNYRVRAVSLAGFTGPWEEISATVTGKSTPPGVPTNFTATGAYRSVNLKWTNPTDKDLNHTEIYYNSSSSTAGRTLLGRSGGTTFIDGPVEPNVPRYYWIRAVDNSNNKSAFTAVKSATPRFVEDNDIDIDVKELLNDAGLSAVEVLDALPTTGNFVGRTVYLTTDRKIYTWNGTQWTSVDSEFDGILSEQNFPTNLRPVEIVSALPTTGNFYGRTVFFGGKLYRFAGGEWVSTVFASDIAGQITNTQIGPNAIKTPQLDANSVTADQLAANSVIFGKVAAGAIAADAIRSNSIAARHLLVGDFTNLVPNADISDVPSWGIAPQWTVSKAGPNYSGMYVTSATVSGSSTGVVISEPFSVDGGAQYYASIQARVNASGQSVQLACTVRWEDTEGNIISSSIVKSGNPAVTSVTVTTIEVNVTAPATATRGRFFWQVNGGTGTIYVGSPTVRRRNDGKLIVDGAIQANHMTANSVTAGVIAAGAINAAALFVDGVITASKLNVDSFSTTGLAIFGGGLQSNNFNLADGTGWRIQNNGTFNIPNAVITNGKIANAAVDTLKIAGKSVTVPAFVSAQSNDIQMNYVLTGPPGETYEVFVLGSMTISQGGNLRLLINGSERWIETPQSGTLAAKGYVQVLGPGTHFIRLIHSNSANTNGGSLYVLATKR